MPTKDYAALFVDSWADAFSTRAVTYPVFAESSQREAKSIEPKVDDTGPFIRALSALPADAHRSEIDHLTVMRQSLMLAGYVRPPNFTNVSLLGLVGANTKDMYLTENVQPLTLGTSNGYGR